MNARAEPNEKSLVATTLQALPFRERRDESASCGDEIVAVHMLKVASRWDREVLAVAVRSSALLLTLGAAVELLAS
jgi:hypothetical protein